MSVKIIKIIKIITSSPTTVKELIIGAHHWRLPRAKAQELWKMIKIVTSSPTTTDHLDLFPNTTTVINELLYSWCMSR